MSAAQTTADAGRALTPPQIKRLREAKENQFGQCRRPASANGLVQAGWRRVVKSLAAQGFMIENAFGDFCITDAGRAALAAAKTGGA